MQLSSFTPSPILSPLPLPQAPVASSQEAALTLLGPSTAMSHLWGQIRRLAPHVRSLLLLGPPDCGQEAVARLLLDFSPQSQRMFVSLSAAEVEARVCRQAGLASLPSDILLFLPDAQALSLEAQDALLRLLRARRSRPFTVIASAPEDLREYVALGRFLPELAESLCVARVHVPALEDRREDLPMLITHLLATESRGLGCAVPQITEGFLRAAMQYHWPGNLRELARALRLLCSHGLGELRAEHLPDVLTHAEQAEGVEAEPARLVSLDTVMYEHIGSVLRACRGNKLRAAEVLGISRSTLYRMLDAASAGSGAALGMAG